MVAFKKRQEILVIIVEECDDGRREFQEFRVKPHIPLQPTDSVLEILKEAGGQYARSTEQDHYYSASI